MSRHEKPEGFTGKKKTTNAEACEEVRHLGSMAAIATFRFERALVQAYGANLLSVDDARRLIWVSGRAKPSKATWFRMLDRMRNEQQELEFPGADA